MDETRLCKPHSLTVDSTAGNYAKIAWHPGCPGTRILRGFNIYVSPYPVVKKYPGRVMPDEIRPFNREVYPGDAEGRLDRETYEIENIENLSQYFVHVRAIYTDGSLSVSTNEIRLIVYPQGTIELAPSYSGEQAGFSFTENRYCKTDAIENDLYYYHKDGIDYICSPSRLGPVNRVNLVYAAGFGVEYPIPDSLRAQGEGTDRIAVIAGQNLLIETEGGHMCGLWVVRFDGSGSERQAVIRYFYKPPVAGPVP